MGTARQLAKKRSSRHNRQPTASPGILAPVETRLLADEARKAASVISPPSTQLSANTRQLIEHLCKEGFYHTVVQVGPIELGQAVGFITVFKMTGAAVQAQARIECSFEAGLPDTVIRRSDAGTILVVEGAIERLHHPQALLRDIAAASAVCGFVVVKTPDRLRSSGLLHQGPLAAEPAARQWSLDEFARLLRDHNIPASVQMGHAEREIGGSKIDIVAIAGTHGCWAPDGRKDGYSDPFKVAAIINMFNEVDVIKDVVFYLKGQGVEIHVVDNWSDDGSFEICELLQRTGVIKCLKRFPDRPTTDYEWTKQLDHSSAYAADLDANWIIHYDADEIRCAPWQGVTLVEALRFVDRIGYTAIDFTVLNFGFIDRDPDRLGSIADMHHFEFGRHHALLQQVKGWKNTGAVIDLASTGGHKAQFNGAKVYPLKFLTKHYPLRSIRQATKKVLQDRLPRMQKEREEKQWHVHYDMYRNMKTLLPWHSFELQYFEDHAFFSEYVLERLTGVGICIENRSIPNLNTISSFFDSLKNEVVPRDTFNKLVANATDLAQYASNLETAVRKLEAENADLMVSGGTASVSSLAVGNDSKPAATGRLQFGPKVAFSDGWTACKDRYCIWLVTPLDYGHQRAFDEVAEGVSNAFSALGGSAPVVAQPTEWGSRTPIVFGSHLLAEMDNSALPPESILFNLEQFDPDSKVFSPAYLAMLRRFSVIDYSVANSSALLQVGLTHLKYLPIGFDPAWSRIAKAKVQDIDVLFYGCINPRRKAILQSLTDLGLHVVHLFGIYGVERDSYIARSKVILNIHNYSAAIFEMARVAYLMANGCCVVSEGRMENIDSQFIEGGVSLCAYDDIVARCMEFVQNTAKREALGRQAVIISKRFEQAAYLRQAFADLRPFGVPI